MGSRSFQIPNITLCADGSQIGKSAVPWPEEIYVHAVCNKASASLTLRVLSFDQAGDFTGASQPLKFLTNAVPDYGTAYIGVAQQSPVVVVPTPAAIAVKADAITVGAWCVWVTCFGGEPNGETPD